jgi:hypothetical protein
MKITIIKRIGLASLAVVCTAATVYAGNPDRRGQAGATELLIQPWAQSGGWAGINSANVRGIESERMNVAGLAFLSKTELNFTRTTWLSGSDIFISAFGIGQRINESSVIGLSVMSIDAGEIEITRVDNPDGGLGVYKPSFVNLGVSYARSFSDRIHGGLTLRIISQSTTDVSSQGAAFDAGIQYITGEKDRIKFGIALRNVGTPMAFGGDGLAARGTMQGSSVALTLQQRSQLFELPSLMNIGGSYDFWLADNDDYKLTVAANFTSNSFTNDQIGVGGEFNWKNMFAVRAGYQYEDGIQDVTVRQNAHDFINAGFSINAPFGASRFSLDYAYRSTSPFNGTHMYGVRISL